MDACYSFTWFAFLNADEDCDPNFQVLLKDAVIIFKFSTEWTQISQLREVLIHGRNVVKCKLDH